MHVPTEAWPAHMCTIRSSPRDGDGVVGAQHVHDVPSSSSSATTVCVVCFRHKYSFLALLHSRRGRLLLECAGSCIRMYDGSMFRGWLAGRRHGSGWLCLHLGKAAARRACHIL